MGNLPQIKMPANEIIKVVLDKPEVMLQGKELNSRYTKLALKKRYDEARKSAEGFLNQFPLEHQYDILCGSIVSACLNSGNPSMVIWEAGGLDPTGHRPLGIREKTIKMLTDMGFERTIAESQVTYESPTMSAFTLVHINAVWFCYLQQYCRHKGLPVPESYNDLPKTQRREHMVTLPSGEVRYTQYWAKSQIERLNERGAFLHKRLHIQLVGDKLTAFSEAGTRFGMISGKFSGGLTDGWYILLRHSVHKDGSLRCVAEWDVNPADLDIKNVLGWTDAEYEEWYRST